MAFDWDRYEIPKLFRNKNYEVYPDKKEFVQAVLDILSDQNPKWCLYFFGKPGVGKSHFSVVLLKYFIEKLGNQSASFLTSETYFQKLFDLMNSPTGTSNFMSALNDRDLIVFDDFGNVRGTEWQKEKLHSLLESRFNNVKKTIISSNLTPDEFKRDYGDRLYRRVIQEGQAVEMTPSKHLKTNTIGLE